MGGWDKKMLLLFAGFFLFFVLAMLDATFFSVILGEEGYEPYDPLLENGSYNKEKWAVWDHSRDVSSGCVGDGPKPRNNIDDKFLRYNNEGFITMVRGKRDGYGNICTLGRNTEPVHPTLLFEEDLTRTNMKATLGMSKNNCDWYAGGAIAGKYVFKKSDWEDLEDGLDVVRSKKIYSADSTNWVTTSLELVWDDYNQSHYQIKISGEVVDEGYLAKDEVLNLGGRRWQCGGGYSGGGSFGWKNVRVKDYFGCDPESGEVIVDKQFSYEKFSSNSFDVSDLDGFERFCVEHPAVIFEEGVSRSSKQIYYRLSEEKKVNLDEGEIVRVFYIGNASELGVTEGCEDGAYSLDSDQCEDLTGLVSLSPDVSLTVNKRDITDDSTVEQNSVIRYTGFYHEEDGFNSISSGGGVLFQTGFPKYTCQDTDGHSESPHGDKVSYPNPTQDCYKFRLNGKTLIGGETVSLDDFFDARVVGSGATFYYGEFCGEGSNEICNGELPSGKDNWRVTYEIDNVEDLVVLDTGFPSKNVYERGVSEDYEVVVRNRYDEALDVSLTAVYEPQVISDTIIQSKELTVSGGGSREVSLSAPTAYIGDYEASVVSSVETSAGALGGGNYSFSYSVEKPEAGVSRDTQRLISEYRNETGGGFGGSAGGNFWIFLGVAIGLILLFSLINYFLRRKKR